MRHSFCLGRIGGVKVEAHYSWFVVLVLVSWSLAHRFLPEYFLGWADITYWFVGGLAVFTLFVSVLVHELAHSLVAQALGFEVDGITLFFLGGASNVHADTKRASDEFFIAMAGPLTSFLLSGLFAVALLGLLADDAEGAVPIWYLVTIDLNNTPVAAAVWYLAFANLLLACFNLLPAFPLDGGRMLRSFVWAMTGSRSKATRVAAIGGRTFAVAFMMLGGFQILLGNFLGALWPAVIGWFLYSGASTMRE